MKPLKKHWDKQAMRMFTMKNMFFGSMFAFFMLFCSLAFQANAFAESNTTVLDCVNEEEGCRQAGKTTSEKEVVTMDVDKETSQGVVSLSAWEYVKTFLALLFVIGLLIALLKFMNRKNRQYDQNRMIKNLGGISLGQQKSIQLVTIGDTYFVIGVGEDIRLLKEITDEEEIAKLQEFYTVDEERHLTTGLLPRLLMKSAGKAKEAQHQSNGEMASFVELFKSKLHEVKTERNEQVKRFIEKGHNRND
ncbi:flagellar biosynthetic protein FliO [Sporosarcina sp. HYO08]|uniref:flagellar biosynthetic protein FliO n=1 Tax=Sporosarcina sp. HYO08 TaxID=1759557 RepID=UPI00079CB2A2|nr:flagellar biosynthetic protein FliO [Sporosarcina sp. HYO08]KXH79992.1 hypothetical protein AU377_10995 [Sporosarcina sp. HYO08]